MLRHSLIYLLLSILVVIFARYAHRLVVYIDMFFTYVNYLLIPIFSHTGWGVTIRKILVLILIPIVIAGIPALLYRVIKGRDMPHFIAIVWVIWAVIVLSDILIR
ncbi:hypothetical protein [Legionella antarctica]|uniref:hypothetical protein n=1 Tax=Legionella antarctica TaxID=2708020 RepID=UPI00156336B3|nr:hypothetical protein [Legionella antarctica]